MRAPVLLILATLLLAAGCGNEDESTQGTVTLCDAPEGSWTNLESEAGSWDRSAPQNRVDWTDEAGCAVNLNYVFHRFGEEHCDAETVEFISIGVPIGIPYTGAGAAEPEQDWEPLFFHNTKAVFDFLDPGQVLTSVPEGAVDTGLRSDGRSLWSNEAEDLLFIDGGAEVLVFVPVADEDVACA